MTKKDYEAIAEAIRGALGQEESVTDVDGQPMRSIDELELVYRLSDVFARDNPRFDRARFIQAVRGGGL